MTWEGLWCSDRPLSVLSRSTSQTSGSHARLFCLHMKPLRSLGRSGWSLSSWSHMVICPWIHCTEVDSDYLIFLLPHLLLRTPSWESLAWSTRSCVTSQAAPSCSSSSSSIEFCDTLCDQSMLSSRWSWPCCSPLCLRFHFRHSNSACFPCFSFSPWRSYRYTESYSENVGLSETLEADWWTCLGLPLPMTFPYSGSEEAWVHSRFESPWMPDLLLLQTNSCSCWKLSRICWQRPRLGRWIGCQSYDF